MEATIDLDDRMTNECKRMVTGTLSKMRPADILKIDIKTVREAFIQNEISLNESAQSNSINESEFRVRNKDDDYEIVVAIYKPDNCRPDSPITIFFHGGGWTFYNVESYSSMVKSLATNTNSIWLSVEYRLSPEYKFPTGLNDCKYVLEHVLNNKSEFSTSNAKVGLSGDSSGGHYAALLANEYHNVLDYQILVYPGLDLYNKYESQYEFVKDCYLLVPELTDFFKHNLLEDKYFEDETLLKSPKVSPLLKESFEHLPRTILIAAELDPCVDQSRKYYEKLQLFRVESELHVIKGVHHGFFSYPVLMRNAFSQAQNYLIEFFKKI